MLVYGWGNTLNLVRVSETKVQQEVKNAKTGKTSRVEVGRLVFEEVGTWTVGGGDVLALQWLNINVGSFTFSLQIPVDDANCMCPVMFLRLRLYAPWAVFVCCSKCWCSP